MKRHWGMMLSISVLFVSLTGCAQVSEIGKTVWGSSTREMEKRRPQAIVKTYSKGYWDCMKAMLKVIQDKEYTIFQKDEVKGQIVVMGIPGYVDTTEVGIFFVEVSDQETRIEMSSLSTNAKRAAAKTLFKGMEAELAALP